LPHAYILSSNLCKSNICCSVATLIGPYTEPSWKYNILPSPFVYMLYGSTIFYQGNVQGTRPVLCNALFLPRRSCAHQTRQNKSELGSLAIRVWTKPYKGLTFVKSLRRSFLTFILIALQNV
jgi:hypothetical protein